MRTNKHEDVKMENLDQRIHHVFFYYAFLNNGKVDGDYGVRIEADTLGEAVKKFHNEFDKKYGKGNVWIDSKRVKK